MTRILIIAILLLAAFLRFYNLGDIAKFEYDDQANSYLVYNLVKNHHFSLVGQESSFGGLFWGPWHYLYLTPFYLTTNLHPLGGFIGEAVLGLFTIVSYYFIGSRFFSIQVGLIAAFLRAILITFIVNDLTISPPYPSELVALWFFYFLVRLYQKKVNSFIVLSFLFGMMFSVHVVLFPLILVWILTMLVYKPISTSFTLIAKSALAFLATTFPLILFELRHNFSHVNRFLNTLTGEGRTVGDPLLDRFWYVLSYNVTNFYRLLDSIVLPHWLGWFIFAALVYYSFKQKGLFKLHFYSFLLVATVLVLVVYYGFYPRRLSEYYFLGITPLILLYVSVLIEVIFRSKIGKLFIVIFLTIIIYSNLYRYFELHQTKFALNQKDAAVKTIVDHQRGKGDYSISYLTEYGRHYGF
jgi:hypothetical protein